MSCNSIEMFAATEKVVTGFSQGVNQSAQGTDKVNAIINCHLATGRIGKEGMGPFSLTGQPNAMGGREVGGLANHPRRAYGFLAARSGSGAALLERAAGWRSAKASRPCRCSRPSLRGKIKALWVMATNPAVSLPDAAMVREALGKLELFVISENVLLNDTVASGAHILLPAAAWGEKSGTVTNSERRISRQRSFMPAAGRSQARLVDRVAGGAAPGIWRGLRLSDGGGCVPRTCRPVGLRE